MADSSVTIRVRLTDDGQVKTSLRAVGEQGKAAADQIKAAMAGINFSHATAEANRLSAALAGLQRPLSAIGVAFGTFAGTLGAQIVSSLAQIPHAFQEMIDKAAATNKEMKDFADQVGSSVEEISGVISGLAHFGVAMENIELLLKRLSVTVHDEWPKIAKEVRDANEQQQTSILKVAEAEIRLIEVTQKAAVAQIQANLAVAQSQQKLAEVQKQAARQAIDNSNKEINNANSIRGAQLSLIDAKVRLHELVTGEKLAPEDVRALAIEKAILDIREARQRLFELEVQREREKTDAADRAAALVLQQEQARLAAIKAREDQELQARKTQMEMTTAQLNLDKARGEELERQANAIGRIREEVATLARGGQIDRQLTPDQIVRGVIANAASQGAEAIGQFGDSFAEIGAKAPNLLPVLYQLSDVLRGTGDRALATAVLVKLFGKAVSGDLVDAMMEGSAALRAEAAAMKKVGLAATEEDAAVGERFVKSRNRFFAHLELLKNKVGTEFARFPGFATWDRLLLENQETVRKWAATLGQHFDSVSFALGNLLTGKSFEQFEKEMQGKMSPEQLLQVKEWQESLQKIANAFKMLANGIVAIWNLLTPIVAAVAAIGRAIGELFGMGDAGEGLAVVLAIGLIIAALRAIPALAVAATAAVGRLFAMAAPAWLLALFAAAGKAGLAGAAAFGGGLGIFKAGEASIVDKYQKDLDELNAKFKDKSSAGYAAGLAKIRKEFQEDIKNLEEFRNALGIPKSGAFEALEKELGLLKDITTEKEKHLRLDKKKLDDDVIIHDLKIEGAGSDTKLGGGPGTDVLLDKDPINLAIAALGFLKEKLDPVIADFGLLNIQVASANGVLSNFKQALGEAIEKLNTLGEAFKVYAGAIGTETQAVAALVAATLAAGNALDDFRGVLQKTIDSAPQQKKQPAPGQETKPPIPGEGPSPDFPPGDKVLDWERRMKADELSPSERRERARDDREMAPILEFLRRAPRTGEGTLTPEALRSLLRLYNPGGERKTFPRGEEIADGEERAADFRDTLTPAVEQFSASVDTFADGEERAADSRDTFTPAMEQFSASVDKFVIAPRAAEDGGIAAVLATFKQAIEACINALEKFSATLSQAAVPFTAAPSKNLKDLIDAIEFATPDPESRGGPNPWERARASGGMITGPGSGTSDSIMARLSNGEFVMNARSVSRYGVPFMRAVNSGRFALGGLVEGLTSIMPPLGLPRFAEGGMARAMSNVTIQFPGLPPIGGLRATGDVVDELRKAAVLAQVRSGGRKPSRYS